MLIFDTIHQQPPLSLYLQECKSTTIKRCTTTLYHRLVLKSLSRKRFFIAEDLRKAKLSVNNLVQIMFPEFKSLFSNIYSDSAIAILK